MSYLEATAYGLIQGATEFLPVSSSGHLALAPWLFGWEDPGLAFDVALHMGTLAAVLAYFWRDWLEILAGTWRRPRGPEARLLAQLVLATLPAVAAGLLLERQAETAFRDPSRIALALIAFGLLLGWADRTGEKRLSESGLGTWAALGIGAAQALALVPGVSRSGVTLTAGLALGLTRGSAARFSFLLSTPIIAGAGILKLRDIGPADLTGPFLWGVLVSAASGFAAVGYFLRKLSATGVAPYVAYRVAFGLLVLGVAAFR